MQNRLHPLIKYGSRLMTYTIVILAIVVFLSAAVAIALPSSHSRPDWANFFNTFTNWYVLMCAMVPAYLAACCFVLAGYVLDKRPVRPLLKDQTVRGNQVNETENHHTLTMDEDGRDN